MFEKIKRKAVQFKGSAYHSLEVRLLNSDHIEESKRQSDIVECPYL